MTSRCHVVLYIGIVVALLLTCGESNPLKLKVFDRRHHTHPQKQHASSSSTLLDSIKTQVGTVADAFAPLLQPQQQQHANDMAPPDIRIPQLLKACRTFQQQMERVGQARSSRDLSANIRKVQVLYDQAPHDHRDSMTRLLHYEKSLNIHPRESNVLKDPSAAIGLLWIRRSIAFQTHWYQQLLAADDPHSIDVTEAAKQAYRRELQPFHGYLLQNIFLGVGISAMTPPMIPLLARLGGFDDASMTSLQQQATLRDLRRLVNVWDPLLTRWTTIMKDMDMEDHRRI
jgi:hypothetical protein